MYTLPAGAAQVNSTLCVRLKMRLRGKSSSGGSAVLKIPLTHVEVKQGYRGRGRTKALTMLEEFRAVHLYFLKLSLRPSPEPCRPLSKQF